MIPSLSYAQNGEDRILWSLIYNIFKKTHPISYMDIGCNNPIFDNNTYFFYFHGGSGVLVEPNPHYSDMIKITRPRDAFYNVGIAFDEKTEAEYYDFGLGSGLNTFSKNVGELVETRWSGVKLQRKIILPLLNINEILKQHFNDNNLDILSIDCEGLDVDIIKSFDFTIARPKIICLEQNRVDLKRDNNYIHYLASKSYIYISTNYVNDFFIDITTIKNNDFIQIPPPPPQSFYFFSNDRHMIEYSGQNILQILHGALSSLESEGIWSSHETGNSVFVDIPQTLPAIFTLTLVVRCTIPMFVTFKFFNQKNRIYINSCFQKYTFQIKSEKGDHFMEIIPENPSRPIDNFNSSDERLLGIFFKSILFSY